ncbi:MAG: hypothetical protein K9N51_07795 [Candidatus Pacebacteria bacterium]|nr:hypothetical protein [Candidatus Paceibacterota bacterium]
MKTTFNIDLACDYVAPPAKRWCVYCFMHLYVLLCGIALVMIAHLSTRRLVAVVDQHREINNIRYEFRRQHPGESDMVRYVRELQDKLSHAYGLLNGMTENVGDRVEMADILLGMASRMPDHSAISSFAWGGAGRELFFEVTVPYSKGMDKATSPQELIASWQSDPALSMRLDNITSLSTERRTERGRNQMVLTFEAELTE